MRTSASVHWCVTQFQTTLHYFSVSFMSMIVHIKASGILLEPPSRSSLWRFKYTDPILTPFQKLIQPNYDDMNINCGGRKALIENEGKCGVCGDMYSAIQKDNEQEGKYALGIITRYYKSGQFIPVQVQITVDRKGYFEFYLCPRESTEEKVTQVCFERHPLLFQNGLSKWYLPEDPQLANGNHRFKIKLPDEIKCSKCVIRWRYRAGNSWGSENGKQGLGLGQQEEFYGCADVAIKPATFQVSTHINVEVSTNIETTSTNLTTIKSFANAAFKKSFAVLQSRNGAITIANISLNNFTVNLPKISENLTSESHLATVTDSSRHHQFTTRVSDSQNSKLHSNTKKPTGRRRRQRSKRFHKKLNPFQSQIEARSRPLISRYRISAANSAHGYSVYVVGFSLALVKFLKV